MSSRGVSAIMVGILVFLVAGTMLWRPRLDPPPLSREPARNARDVTPVQQTRAPASTLDQAGLKAIRGADSIWVRPSAEAASRNFRRAGFAWILRQLGASDRLLDRMADGDLEDAIKELKEQAAHGDASAINILGEIAYQRCYLGRDAATLDGYQASQLNQAGTLGAADAAWFGEALRSDVAYDKSVMAMCKRLIDPDQVFEWVAAQAKEGNGASQWLMANVGSNMHDRQERLRDAASAGFPEAQFELAWAIIGHQEGAAGSGADAANVGDLLRASADTIPRSEAQLAACEYSGCPGVTADLEAAVTHARDAARRGSIDGLLAIGPHLAASQMDPDEVMAWTVVHASLQLRGCDGNGFSVQWMQQTAATLSASNLSAGARALADQYWQQYGAQMMSNLGCGS